MGSYTGRTLNKSIRQGPNLGEFSIIIVTAILFIILSFTTDTFFSYSNIYSVLFGISMQFFAVIGFTYLMIMGEIDMSVGAMYGFGGALLGTFVMVMKLPFLFSLILTLIITSFLGFINGFLVVKFRLNSMMITIGMMSVVKGLTSILITVLGSRIFPSVIRNLVKFKLFGIHWSIVALIFLVIALEILLYRASVFRKMYYVGQNTLSAKIYGIKAEKIKIITFVISSVMASFGGILATSRITFAYNTTGDKLEFLMVTAAVLGGASLFGGRGSILRSVVGLLFLAIMQNGMIIFGIDPYYQQISLGLILAIAVYLDNRLNSKKG